MSKTVRVRIAVAVDPFGSWGSYGSSDSLSIGEQYMAKQALIANLDRTQARIVFIEAEVPLPEPVTVEAVVVEKASVPA